MPSYLIPSGRLLTTGDFLDVTVRKVMSPGVVAISEEAPLEAAYEALIAYRVHALLVVGAERGTPLGWTTAKGLLAFAEQDTSIVSARDAITEEAHPIDVGKTVRDAIVQLSRADTSHLVVVEEARQFPMGTVSDLDLAAFLGHRG